MGGNIGICPFPFFLRSLVLRSQTCQVHSRVLHRLVYRLDGDALGSSLCWILVTCAW